MPEALVHLDVSESVGTITLDSPANRNALSRQLVTELLESIERAEHDDRVKIVVVASSGKVFCSGADLSEAASGGMEEGAAAIVRLQRQIVSSSKPYVCAIGGPVRAGGLGIVGACDLVICADDVTFAFTESRLALAPAVISLTLVPKLSARGAADVFLTGRTFGAREAAELGLVTHVVAGDDLEGAVRRTCADLAKAHPQGLSETKALLNSDVLLRIDTEGGRVAEQSARLFGSEAAREAMVAFLSRKR